MVKQPKVPDFNALVAEQGGYGRMQFFYFLVITAGINSVGWE
jgi:hypothetical protein